MPFIVKIEKVFVSTSLKSEKSKSLRIVGNDPTCLKLLEIFLFFGCVFSLHDHVASWVTTELADYFIIRLELINVFLHQFDVLLVPWHSFSLHAQLFNLGSDEIYSELAVLWVF